MQDQRRNDMAAGPGMMLDASDARYDVQAVIEAFMATVDQDRAAVVIESENAYHIHTGAAWVYSERNALGNAGTRDIILSIGGVPMHWLYELAGAAKSLFQFFEGTTHDLGAALTHYNKLRPTSGAAPCTINVSAAGGSDGTEIIGGYLGDKKTGSMAQDEWVLAANTKYLLRLTSGAADSLMTTVLHCWEH